MDHATPSDIQFVHPTCDCALSVDCLAQPSARLVPWRLAVVSASFCAAGTLVCAACCLYCTFSTLQCAVSDLSRPCQRPLLHPPDSNLGQTRSALFSVRSIPRVLHSPWLVCTRSPPGIALILVQSNPPPPRPQPQSATPDNHGSHQTFGTHPPSGMVQTVRGGYEPAPTGQCGSWPAQRSRPAAGKG